MGLLPPCAPPTYGPGSQSFCNDGPLSMTQSKKLQTPVFRQRRLDYSEIRFGRVCSSSTMNCIRR